MFQPCFVRSRKWFRSWVRPVLVDDSLEIAAQASNGREGDSVMLEAILIMLGLSSCALVLVAFWGSEVLGTEWRSRR